MSVASHLAVSPGRYDARIRALIPFYDELIAEAARALRLADRPVRRITDLGIGTGALARACLAAAPRARIVGIDADAAMMRVARTRLRRWQRQVTMIEADFVKTNLPRSDAIVATFSLHHIRRTSTKLSFYRRCHEALAPGGILISGDCVTATRARNIAADINDWVDYLSRTAGSRAAARRIYDSWSDEDTYQSLSTELRLLQRAGFAVDVPWRRSPFAVIAAVRER